MRAVLRIAFVVGAALALCAASAFAGECATAKQHLVVARRAVAVHDYAKAIEEYQASYELDGEPVTLVMLGQTYARIGDWWSAIDVYRAYLEQVPVGARAYDVEQEIDRLSARLLSGAIPIFDDSDELARQIPIFN